MTTRDLWKTRISEEMARQGISQAELERAAGFKRNRIANWLQDKSDPPIDAIEKLAAALGIPVWHLYVENPADVARLKDETREARKRFEPGKQEAFDEAVKQLTLLAEEHTAELLEAFAQDLRRQRALLRLAASRAAKKSAGNESP